MTKRNPYIMGGIAVFLTLAVGYWFTAPYWSAMRTKAEAKRLIVASLPDGRQPSFRI